MHPAESTYRPTNLGRYSAIASLGQGGMANVYLALMSGPARFSKLLVLKVLREDIEANRDEMAAMFLDEARLAARLQHRNIVQTNEFGEIDGKYYMAMEYLDGHTLRGLQRKVSPIPLEEELRILAETAHGVHYAHELTGLNGEPLCVVHRDVSPQNVFVTYDGQVKLLDFGIAKVHGAEHLTQVGVIKGKIDYIAPEQVRGEKIDRRADVFSLGAMLWEAITGARFGGAKVPEVTKFHNRLTGGEPKLRDLKPDVPPALAAIVDEAIALDPQQRMPTAELFAERIEAYLATLPVRPSEKSLSALMNAAFQEERTKLRKIVDEQCKKILESPPLSMSQHGLDLRLVSIGAPDLSAPGTGSRVEPLPSALERTSPKKWRSFALLGGAGAAIAAVVLLVLGTNRQAPEVKAASAPSSQLAPEPPATATAAAAAPGITTDKAANFAERSVKVSIDVAPRDAQVLLDGVPLTTLPFSGSFQFSGAMHRLEISASGYQAVRRFVTFDKDQNIQVQLQAAQATAPVRARGQRTTSRAEEPVRAASEPVPSPAPASARADEPAPGAPLKSRSRSRGFDMQDPYAE